MGSDRGQGALTAVLLVLRSGALARMLGTRADRAVRRERPSVDPEAWAEACLNFRADISATFRRGFPRSVFAYCRMLAADLLVLVLCLRFVGVGPEEASLADIAIAHAFDYYPFTLFPFSGLGVVDAVILASLVSTGDTALEAAVVAALIVWRVFTVLVPVLLGALAVATWRRTLPTPLTHRPPRDRSGRTTPLVHHAWR